ncbi:7tm 6 domain containing protein [Asbolus verrucosus]|uniref:Odorant receptor n=1 Tax=Asbolus verrucosus TaxID=1661398 RepID=A0A482V9U8_ASBVE|nr:7tm 6 domain containing protein [Asbolus verrucosus]
MEDMVWKSFSINLKVMRILRLYPPEKSRGFYKVQAYIVYFLCIVLLPVLIILYILSLDEDLDLLKLNYTAIFLVETISFITKLLPFIISSHQIKKCINYFGCPYFRRMRYKDNQKKIIAECTRICRRNSLVWVIGVGVGTICYNVQPLLWEGYKLPIDLWLPYDVTAGPEIYYLTYILSSIIVSYNAFSGSIIDPLIGGLACQAAGQMEILRNNLQYLSEHVDDEISVFSDGKNTTSYSKSDIIYDEIQKCVHHHNAILNFVQEYEKSFSLVVFSQFAGSGIAIGLCCLSFSLNNHLADSIYMSRWYEYDSKSKKALFLLMERSKRPMILTAGKIIALTLETFTQTLKKSYSLLAVLKSYQ